MAGPGGHGVVDRAMIAGPPTRGSDGRSWGAARAPSSLFRLLVSHALPHRRLYYDLDGVLADFDAGRRALLGADVPDVNDSLERLRPGSAAHAAKLRLYEALAACPAFYRDLPLLPGALELWAAGTEADCGASAILTAIPSFTRVADPARAVAEATAAKRAWVAAHLGVTDPALVIVTQSHLKGRFHRAHPGHLQVLIDDRARNCAEWTAAGGTAIHHTRLDTSLRAIADLRHPALGGGAGRTGGAAHA